MIYSHIYYYLILIDALIYSYVAMKETVLEISKILCIMFISISKVSQDSVANLITFCNMKPAE